MRNGFLCHVWKAFSPLEPSLVLQLGWRKRGEWSLCILTGFLQAWWRGESPFPGAFWRDRKAGTTSLCVSKTQQATFQKPCARFWSHWVLLGVTQCTWKQTHLVFQAGSEANLLSPSHLLQFAEAGGTMLVWVKSEPSAQATNLGVLSKDFSYFSLDGHTWVYT